MAENRRLRSGRPSSKSKTRTIFGSSLKRCAVGVAMLAARPALRLAASWQLRQAKKAAKRAADELKAAALERISVEYIMPPINATETLARLGAERLEAKLNEHAKAINHIIANRNWSRHPASRHKTQLQNRRQRKADFVRLHRSGSARGQEK